MEHITREVNQLPGIQKLSFVLRTRQATVVYDPAQVTADAILQALERANASIARANDPAPAELQLLMPDLPRGPERTS